MFQVLTAKSYRHLTFDGFEFEVKLAKDVAIYAILNS